MSNKGKTFPIEILTPDEVRALVAQCSETTMYGIRHRALIILLYRTGLRIGEAFALRAHDVDLAAGSVAVLFSRGGRQRTIGIDPGAFEHIEAWSERRTMLDVANDAPLFCTSRGTPLSYSTFRELLRRLAREAGIHKRVNPHGFRHTHAYELAMEGFSMPIIQRQLGHVSLATTDLYLSGIAAPEVIDEIGKRVWEP